MKKGFTLIELLVVVAIIGLLSSVVISSLNVARANARTTSAIQDLKQLQIALELYHTDHGKYPSTSGRWDGLYSCWGNSTKDWIPGLAPTYIPELPRSPNNSTSCGNNYIYRSINGSDYKLIWHGGEDCNGVKKRIPTVLDPTRDGGTNPVVQEYNTNCWAYGIWSEGGVGY